MAVQEALRQIHFPLRIDLSRPLKIAREILRNPQEANEQKRLAAILRGKMELLLDGSEAVNFSLITKPKSLGVDLDPPIEVMIEKMQKSYGFTIITIPTVVEKYGYRLELAGDNPSVFRITGEGPKKLSGKKIPKDNVVTFKEWIGYITQLELAHQYAAHHRLL